MALIEKALFVDRLQRPPLGLDIIVLIGDVRIVHVAPKADAIAHLTPLRLVLPDGLLAGLDERLHAVRLDLLLAVQAELFFDLELHGKTVRVPARLTQNVVALHRLIARDQVLDAAGEHMPDVRLAVCRGRTVKERKGRLALAPFHALFKDAVFLPKCQCFLLAGNKVHVCRNFLVHLFLQK